MKRNLIIAMAFLLGFGSTLKADEGMWIPMLINNNIVEMQEMGLKLSAEDIYSVNNSSMKDAIIIFGGGCTGEIISPEGLILTNHHCGYGSIQQVSTDEHNYLDDGFWAMNKKEEIAVDGLSVKFLVRMEDATARSLDSVTADMTEEARAKMIRKNNKLIIEEATKDNNYKAIVETFFGGNEYYLFVYEVFTDIRLVGTPPESIGKFGADTDNWMWPRHTGDFSMFRVYAAPNGTTPAEYSEENVPLKPKHYLPVNITGVEKGDFAMIMGNPGGTDRYLSSFGVDLAVSESNMTIVKIREEKLRLMREGMDADESVRLQYASKHARTANYWKYFIGQTKGLKNLKVKEKKQAEEAEFSNWVNKTSETKATYGEVINMISSAYDKIAETNLAKWYFIEGVYRGPEILGYSRGFGKLEKVLNEKDNKEAVNELVGKLKAGIDGHFKDYNMAIDQNMFASMMQMFHKNVPLDQQPAYLLEMDKKFKGDYNAYAAYVFEKSLFGDKTKVEKFLDNPKAKTLKKDPAIIAINAFINNYRTVASTTTEAEDQLEKGHRMYIAGLREMNPEKNFYPDANFTMRLTYGTVLDYFPADAVHFDYFTTIEGIMQKEDPSTFEFVVPAKLKELYDAKDYGEYGSNGTLNVCFLTTHDITGGNSGSPVINGNGELIGLAFDGNWEAMSGDIAFEPELQRTINVDIRYVMFVIDKFAGAQNIIDEMTIIREKPVMVEDIKIETEVSEDAITE
jgi:hypothetical protein